jgi:hypothetical protein
MWEVSECAAEPDVPYYVVRQPGTQWVFFHLPKSEYVLCEPPPAPVEWVDVTEECIPVEKDDVDLFCQRKGPVLRKTGYRLRKVQLYRQGFAVNHPQWAFVVERREQP